MEESLFNSFKEANQHAKTLIKQGWRAVRLIPSGKQFKVSGTAPAASAETTSPPEMKTHDDTVLCIDCQDIIPENRLRINPNALRCVSCQNTFEKTHDTRTKIDEGIAGSREENKKMRGQIWGDIRKRNMGG